MKTIFGHVAPADKQYLLIGDTDHYDPKTQNYLFSADFIQEAARRGFTRLLIETPPEETDAVQAVITNARRHFGEGYNLEMATALGEVLAETRNFEERHTPCFKGLILADALGMKFHGADPRGENKEEQLQIAARALTALMQGDAGGTREFLGVLDWSKTGDDALLNNIRTFAGSEKTIVIYGASHFQAGSPVETGIPVAERCVVLPYTNSQNTHKLRKTAPPDAIHVKIEREKPLSLAHTKPAERKAPGLAHI